jgi:hypothetical protein
MAFESAARFAITADDVDDDAVPDLEYWPATPQLRFVSGPNVCLAL